MCSSPKRKKASKAPVERKAQRLVNRRLDDPASIANMGIGSLTIRSGESTSFNADGSVQTMMREGKLAPGAAQAGGGTASGTFQSVDYGAADRAAAKAASDAAAAKAAAAKKKADAEAAEKKRQAYYNSDEYLDRFGRNK